MNSTALEAILDVAIGMIFMWLILSIATMSVQEWIASYLKWRAKDLETAIQRLLADKVWAEQLYNHPLIAGLSKKAGRKPSYIPANKFALALFDIVTTAGTQESYIQQRILAANRELKKAPNQLVPFLVYVFKRFGSNIGKFFNRVLYFFGSDKGTPDQKYTAVLKLAQNLLHANDPEKTEDMAQSWKEFFKAVLSDKTNMDGKVVSTPSVDFLEAYPVLHNYFYDLLQVILKKQPILKQRWAEIIIYNDEKLIEAVKEKLQPGETLREKLRELFEEYAKEFDLEKESLESIVMCVQQTLDEIDYTPLIQYVQKSIGIASTGLDAIQKFNPQLHKSFQQLYNDIIGIANNSQMLEAVRTRFAIAAVNLEKVDHNLAAMRLNSETWFNESMDRLSGWYKRKATLLAFLIGLVLAAILNVDSIILAEHLWKEPSVRQALVANATKFTEDNETLPESLGGNNPQDAVNFFNEQLAGLNIPLGWTFENINLESYEENGETKYETCSLFPIGKHKVWGIQEKDSLDVCQKIGNAPANTAGWFLKVLGIILSAGAAAQGAPFWFDILKKLVNIRGSGANPDEKEK